MTRKLILTHYRKSQPPCEAVNWNTSKTKSMSPSMSQPPCEAVNWNVFPPKEKGWSLSASLWGCELKFLCGCIVLFQFCQPPCEAVNWNKSIHLRMSKNIVSLLVRLWIEMKWLMISAGSGNSQPPCEAVNWNAILLQVFLILSRQPPCEAVNWNFIPDCNSWKSCGQPPCEAVNWNSTVCTYRPTFSVSLLVRLWIEIN